MTTDMPTEILVPVVAEYRYERNISIGADLATRWGLPLRLVHVRVPGVESGAVALEVSVDSLRRVHPDLTIDGVETEADDVADGIQAASVGGSLLVLASDHATQWLEIGSVGEATLAGVEKHVVLCGAGCDHLPKGAAVIVPLDGSTRAEAALEPALRIAAASEAKVWLVTIVPPSTVEAVAKQRHDGNKVSESGYLRSVATRLSEQNIDVSWEVAHHGDPVAGIIGVARDLDSMLIVAATQGETGVSKRVFGSVALGLVERGTSPVMLVKADTEPAIPLEAARD